MTRKPSRAVTQKCAACARPFTARRKDARYCSGRCRQRGARARAAGDELAVQIEAARRHYWALVRRAAEARGVGVSQVETEQAQLVDERGNVYMGGPMGGIGDGARLVGRTAPGRTGWSAWGLEAAGPPFSAPPSSPAPEEPERQARGARVKARASHRKAQRRQAEP